MGDQAPDIIVVGGGSAGAAMTGRLAEAGLRVLLIEAGESDRRLRSRVPALTSKLVQNPQFDWCLKVDPDPTVGGARKHLACRQDAGRGKLAQRNDLHSRPPLGL